SLTRRPWASTRRLTLRARRRVVPGLHLRPPTRAVAIASAHHDLALSVLAAVVLVARMPTLANAPHLPRLWQGIDHSRGGRDAVSCFFRCGSGHHSGTSFVGGYVYRLSLCGIFHRPD